MSTLTSNENAVSETDPGASATGRGTVIVGVDGSDTATEAAKCAARLAAESNVSLTLVIAHPTNRSAYMQGPGGDCWDISVASSARGIARQVASTLGTIVDQIDIVDGEGKPADVLVEQAKRLNASMIVVGNRRVQGASRVLGAIATAVLRNAPCDVHVAKTV